MIFQIMAISLGATATDPLHPRWIGTWLHEQIQGGHTSSLDEVMFAGQQSQKFTITVAGLVGLERVARRPADASCWM